MQSHQFVGVGGNTKSPGTLEANLGTMWNHVEPFSLEHLGTPLEAWHPGAGCSPALLQPPEPGWRQAR